MSKKKELADITEPTGHIRKHVTWRRISVDADFPSGPSMERLADQVMPSLTKAITSAKVADQTVDLIISKLGDQSRQIVVQIKADRMHERFKAHASPVEKEGMILVRRHPGPALSTDALAERLVPEAPVPSPAQALQAQRDAEVRWSMLEEFGAYTSEELGKLRSRAKNVHALANRWRNEGRIFSVELRGQQLYPGFQFDPETYSPRAVVSAVLTALPREQMSEWEVALWWVAGNPWLEGRRPVDLIDERDEEVVEAAARLTEPSAL